MNRALDEARKQLKTVADNTPPALKESAEKTLAQTEDALGELQEHAKNVARTMLEKLQRKS